MGQDTRRNRLKKLSEGFIKICECPVNFGPDCRSDLNHAMMKMDPLKYPSIFVFTDWVK